MRLTAAERRALAAFVDLALVTEQHRAQLCRRDEYVTVAIASYGQLVALGEAGMGQLYEKLLQPGGDDGEKA